MSHQPSRHARGHEAVRGTGPGVLAHQPDTGQAQGRNESWLADTDPRAARRLGPAQQDTAGAGAWVPERRQPAPSPWRDQTGARPGRGQPGASAPPPQWTGPPVAPNGANPSRDSREGPAHGQTVTVSVPALRTFLTLAAVVVLSVVLSVIATLTIIAVMNAGVILPQYARLNQPTQLSQLGICVSKTGKITRPTDIGFCHGGTFVHVQPTIIHP